MCIFSNNVFFMATVHPHRVLQAPCAARHSTRRTWFMGDAKGSHLLKNFLCCGTMGYNTAWSKKWQKFVSASFKPVAHDCGNVDNHGSLVPDSGSKHGCFIRLLRKKMNKTGAKVMKQGGV
eukprot:m.25715 g.25715  ORF g.25715 m.25715 type:complete len:121 (-) comp5794_c0_seq1:243-605(-)